MFTNREIAIAIWIFLGLSFALWKSRPWDSLRALVRSIMSRPIRIILGLATSYIVCCVYLLHALQFWALSNLKTTLVWVVGFALVSLFRTGTDKNEKEASYFRTLLRESVSINVIITFIASAYAFSIPVEMLLTGTVILMTLLIAVAEGDEKTVSVATLLSAVLSIVGIAVIAFSIYQIVNNFPAFASLQNAREFVVPALLSLMLIPFLYALHVYMAYETAYSRMRRSIKNPLAQDYARRQTFSAFKLDLDGLRKWLRHIGLFRPDNEADVMASIVEIKSVRRRERRPYRVPPLKGWPPESARNFLRDIGITAGDYHRSYEGWRAASPPFKLGRSIFENTVEYIIEGDEYAVMRLRLTITVSEQLTADVDKKKFELMSSCLLSKALNKVGMTNKEFSITAGAAPVIVNDKKITLTKEDWTSSDSYELEMTVEVQ